MLHQENSDAYVRHHSEQLACGNMTGADSGRPNFLPEKCQVAVCQRGEKVGSFDEELAHGLHLATATVQPGVTECGVGETSTMDHNKRPASNGLLDMVECKRMKQEDQITAKKDSYIEDADEDVHDYPMYTTCERSFDSPAHENEESDDEGVDSPIYLPRACIYAEDDIWPTGFHQPLSLSPTRKPVPIGPNHQAELPEFRPSKGSSMVDKVFNSAPSHISDGGMEDESEKWIRNCIMTMPSADELCMEPKPVHSKAVCDCFDKDSINCVRKHVREAREKLKLSIGADTFEELGFCYMGEDVASRWTGEEEHLFQEVVSSNPASLCRNFWDELSVAFPAKSSKELVSYYFNVFMLRKRAEQNRFDPMNVDSDDDEWQVAGGRDFRFTERADECCLHSESLTDQDDVACNQVPANGDFCEDSDEEDELGTSGDKHDVAQGGGMLSEGLPTPSFVDHNQQTFKLDADGQDDSCTSFEAHQGPAEAGTSGIAEDHHYRNDGFGGVAEHVFFGDHCDSKIWEIGLTNGWEKDEFLSTNNVIEEVFGKGSWQNGDAAASGQDID